MNELIPTPVESLGVSGIKKLMTLNKDSDREIWHEANLSLPEEEQVFKFSLDVQLLREKLIKKGIVKL